MVDNPFKWNSSTYIFNQSPVYYKVSLPPVEPPTVPIEQVKVVSPSKIFAYTDSGTFELEMTENARGFISMIGGGGSGGAYVETDFAYSPGAGGGGGGQIISTYLNIQKGAKIVITVPKRANEPNKNGGQSSCIITDKNGVSVYVAYGGIGGETWDSKSRTPPVGGSGGASMFPSDYGTGGMSSFVLAFSQAAPVSIINGGITRHSPDYGSGGDGALSSVYDVANFGGSGLVVLDLHFYI